jgi:autotransporter passenger strand-loop-strand repeat protein
VYSGGSEIIASGGVDLGALISGGTQLVFGYASGVTLFSGSQVVEAGGRYSAPTSAAGSAAAASASSSRVAPRAGLPCSAAAPASY